jgi:parallel beta-helix repeat protein
MKKRCLLITLALGLSLTLALLWILGSLSSSVVAAPSVRYVEAPDTPAAELHICPAGPPTCDYSSVQAAVDAASPDDVIKVAAGTYTDVSVRLRDDLTTTGVVTQVIYISKTVTIQGGYTTTNWTTPDPEANPTTLDAQGQGRVLYITGEISPTIEGLRVTGGDATGLGGAPGYDAGGGVYMINATAVISNIQVFNNTADDGGGLCLLWSDSELNGNTITNNTANWGGGGVYLMASDATLSGNRISSNIGNGLSMAGSNATLSGNTVANNAGDYGGGLSMAGSDATLSGNIIFSNTANWDGGGLQMYRSDPTLTNNIVADNQANAAGSGLYIVASSPHLLHTTIAHNSGGDGSGICVVNFGSNYSTVALANTILVSHTVGITVAAGNVVTLEATLWGDGDWTNNIDWGGMGTITTGTINVWGAPGFSHPDTGDYHLKSDSLAINRGRDVGVVTDIDGDARPDGCFPDIGADEFITGLECKHIYLPLVLRSY